MAARRVASNSAVSSDELVEQIVDAIGLSERRNVNRLKRQLFGLREHAAALKTTRAAISNSEILKALDPVEASCRTIIALLDADPKEDTPSDDLDRPATLLRRIRWHLAVKSDPANASRIIQDGRISEIVARYRQAVQDLLDAATATKLRLEAQIDHRRGGSRHVADEALREITLLLFDYYHEATGKFPAITAGGPTARFLRLCLPHAGWSLKDSAIRELIREVRPIWRHGG
jgi:hypothetical protein